MCSLDADDLNQKISSLERFTVQHIDRGDGGHKRACNFRKSSPVTWPEIKGSKVLRVELSCL